MRVLQAKTKRPLDLLAIGAGGHIAAACSTFHVRGDVDVWEVASGKAVFTQNIDEREVHALAFTPDGRHVVASGSKPIMFLKTTDGSVTVELTPELIGFPEFTFSNDGKRLLATESVNQYGGIDCWTVYPDLTFHRDWREGPHAFGYFYTPALSPDGVTAAVTTQDRESDRVRVRIELRDTVLGKIRTHIDFDAADPTHQLLFSADSTKLLTRSSGRSVKVFDAATGQPAGELVHPGRPYVSGMAVHPNGTVACSRNNGTVCLWNLEKRELVRTLDWKLGKLVSVAFSPDGTIGAAGTEDGQVIVWDVDE